MRCAKGNEHWSVSGVAITPALKVVLAEASPAVPQGWQTNSLSALHYVVLPQVVLSTKSFSCQEGSAQVAAAVTQAQSGSLKELDLSDIVSGRFALLF